MIGRGFDRHLLGLRLLLRPLNGENAALFGDDLFDRSAQWKLSTSGLSAGLLFKGTGFGAMYEDGYGINCELNDAARFLNQKLLFLNLPDLAAPNMVKFGIESKFSSLLTSTQKFKEAVAASLEEMQSLCEVIVEEDSKLVLTSHL